MPSIRRAQRTLAAAAAALAAACVNPVPARIACDTHQDCLSDQRCANHFCEKGPRPKCPAPENLVAVFVPAENKAHLTWLDKCDDESNYVLERQKNGGASVVLVTLGRDATFFDDEDLAAEATFVYRVTARNTEGDSDYAVSNPIITVPPPPAPADFAATPASSEQVDLSWTDNSTNETAFIIEAHRDTNLFEPIGGDLAPGTVVFHHTGLAPETHYFYRIKARNAAGDSDWATADATTPGACDNPPAPAPSAPSCDGTSPTSVHCTWTDESGCETSFEIARKLKDDAWPTVAVLLASGLPAGTSLAYDDTTAQPATGYTYRVRSRNAVGPSAWSADAEVMTAAQPLVCDPPPVLSLVAATSSGVALAWNACGTADLYSVERKGPGEADFAQEATTTAPTVAWADASVTQGGSYQYRVRAHNAVGWSGNSNVVTATVPTGPTVCPPPALSSPAVRATEVDLAWTETCANETGYELKRDGSAIATPAAGTLAYTDTGRTPATEYAYELREQNGVGASAPSSLTVTTLCAKPVLAASAIADTSATVSWGDCANEDGWVLDRDGVEATLAAGTAARTDTDLAAGTSYAYRLKAHNPGGDSDWSTTLTVTTLCAAPALVLGAVTESSVAVSWADCANETGYVLSVDGAETALAAGTTSKTVSSLSPGTTHTLRLKAVNATGDSAWSQTLTVTTLCAKPALAASAVTATSATVSWGDCANEDRFVLERDGAEAILPAGTTSRNDTDLLPATTYAYRLKAHNAGGDSQWSEALAVTTLCAAPALVLGAVTESSVAISWADCANETQYVLSVDGVDATVAPGTTSRTVSGLAPGTTHTMRLKAANATGDSAWSQTLTVTLPCAAPAGFAAAPASTASIAISWTDNCPSETEWVLQRKTGTGSFAELTKPVAGATAHTDGGLAAGTYTYRLAARNAAGDSAWSEEKSATVVIVVPMGPSYRDVSYQVPAGVQPLASGNYEPIEVDAYGGPIPDNQGDDGSCFVACPSGLVCRGGLCVSAPGDRLLLHFDDSPGSTAATDSSGNGRSVACVGGQCPQFGQPGRFGTAATFDGVDDRLVRSEVLNLGGEYTIEAWFRSGSTTEQYLVEYRSGYAALDIVNGRLRFVSDGTRALTDGRWHHVAFVQAAGKVRLFVDGGFELEQPTATADTSGTLTIGANGNSAAFFKGYLDELRISSRALDPAEFSINLANFHPRAWPGAPLADDQNAAGDLHLFHFNEGAGAAGAADSSGNQKSATCSGAACPSFGGGGRFGSGATFTKAASATDRQRLELPTTTSLESLGTGDFTVELWLRTPPLASGDDPQRTIVFMVNGDDSRHLSLRLQSGSLAGVVITSAGRVDLAGSQAVADGRWHHVALQRSAGVVRLYVDGRLDGAPISGAAAAGELNIAAAGRRALGVEWHAAGDPQANVFFGQLDEVRFAKRALDPSELSINRGAPGSLPSGQSVAGDLALWHLDEAAGAQQAPDSSGNGRAASCSGSTCPTFGGAGRFQRGAVFDGNDDELVLPATSTPVPGQTLTVEAWVRPDDAPANRAAVAKDAATSSHDAWYLGSGYNGGEAWFSFYSGSGSPAEAHGTTVLAANTWYHLAGVVGGGAVKIYVNGRLEQSTPTTAAPSTVQEPWRVGGAGGALRWKGAIDEVRVSSRALSPSEFSINRPVFRTDFSDLRVVRKESGGAETEIASEPRYGGLRAEDQDVAGFWRFDEAPGATSFRDASGRAGAGSCTPPACPTLGAGRFGFGTTFEGCAWNQSGPCTGNRVTLPPVDLSTTDFTIEVWTYQDRVGGAAGSPIPILRADPATSWLLRLRAEGSTDPGAVYFEGDFEGQSYSCHGPVAAPGGWNHLAAVVRRSPAEIAVCVNGACSRCALAVSAAAAPVVAGWLASDENVFGGRMDEIRITKRALAPHEFLLGPPRIRYLAKAGETHRAYFGDAQKAPPAYWPFGAISLSPGQTGVTTSPLCGRGPGVAAPCEWPTAPYAPDPFTVGLWRFDESNGAALNSSGIAGLDGSLLFGADRTTGKFGNALRCKEESRVEVADNDALDFDTGPVTYETWFKTTLQSFARSATLLRRPNILLEVDGTSRMPNVKNWGAEIMGTVPVNNAVWHHVAATRADGLFQLWIDGVVSNWATGVPTNLTSPNGLYMCLDAQSLTPFTTADPGLLDEARISSIARPPEELANRAPSRVVLGPVQRAP